MEKEKIISEKMELLKKYYNLYWDNYVSIERNIKNLKKYVDWSQDNYMAFGLEINNQIIIICSEIDSIFKAICKFVDSNFNTKARHSINKYYDCLNSSEYTKIWKNFRERKYYIKKNNLEFVPWLELNKKDTPEWWKSYNNIKHNRFEKYKEANLKNMLNSLSALYALENLYKEIIEFYFYKLLGLETENYTVENTEIFISIFQENLFEFEKL